MDEILQVQEHENKGSKQQNVGIHRCNEPARNQALIAVISCLYYIKRVRVSLHPT